ncbi:hypothetical protein JCM10207_005742 [Rhodosporidiobolus poonsookiae]
MIYQRTTLLNSEAHHKPNLDPPALDQPTLYQPSADDLPTSFGRQAHASTSGRRRGEREGDKGRKGGKDREAGGAAGKKRKHAGGQESAQGNYKSYYLRRRAAGTGSSLSAPDPRLALVPPEWLKGKKVLDVGCNSGLVTIEIAQRFGAARVTGVDVDAELVKSAKGNVELAWSRQAPLPRLTEEASYLSNLSSRSRHASASRSGSPSRSRSPSPAPPPALPVAPNSASPFAHPSSSLPPALAHFPLSLPRQFGYLPHPYSLLTRYVEQAEVETQGVIRRGKRKVMPEEERAFPENVSMRCADWVEEEIKEDREGYDVIVAFSITKWIHLHSLNPGLLTFFRRLFTSLLPGGRLILEPQPFSTYSTTLKNLRPCPPALQANLERLQEGAERGWRAEEGEFQRVLVESIGFEKCEVLGWTGEEGSSWRRCVEVYTKRGGGSWGV